MSSLTRHPTARYRSLVVAFLSVLGVCLGILPHQAATVEVYGTVNSILSGLTVGSPKTITSSQLTGGVTDLSIVTINERSNRRKGYTVTLWSANANNGSTFKLLGASSSDTITYTMKYNGVNVNLVDGQAVVTDSNNKTTLFGVNKVISVSIPSGFPAADTYSDTITIILADK